MVCLPVSLCQQQHFQTTLTGRECRRRLGETFLRPAPRVPRSAALPPRPSPLAGAPLALPGRCRPRPLRSGGRGSRRSLRGLLGGSPRQPASSPVAPPGLREPLPPSPRPLPAAGYWPPARLAPAPRSAPEPPARLPSRKLRWCCAGPLPAPPLEESGFFFFAVVGERKSASSKISEVQVHQIFLPAACYTLRESDCSAPGALLAVRGCSCFPLSQRQKQKWNLLTLSAVPSPVVVAVADLQAL